MECHKRFHSVELESLRLHRQAFDKFQYFPRHDATLVWAETCIGIYSFCGYFPIYPRYVCNQIRCLFSNGV
jgi:hypothetical protein